MNQPKRPDVQKFGAMSIDERRRLLLRAARSGHSFTMGDFLGNDCPDAVFVVDVDECLDVASRIQALTCAAEALGLQVNEPVAIQTSATQLEYAVWGTPTESSRLFSDPLLLAQAPTYDAAHDSATEVLEGIIGSYVLSLADWNQAKGADYEHLLKRRTVKAPPVFGTLRTAILTPTWVAAGVYTYSSIAHDESEQIQDKDIGLHLAEAGTLTRKLGSKRSAPIYEIRTVHLGDKVYAPFHDLVNAAREGVLDPQLTPYPNINANRYVVHREFVRAMRRKGWRLPWRHEEPIKPLKLYGRLWVRDAPISDTF